MSVIETLLDETWEQLKPFTMVKRDRFLTSLQLALRVQNIPGDVAECGVWRGGMVAGIASTLGNDRRYHLFDSFEGLPPADLKRDGRRALTLTGKCRAGEHYAKEAMAIAGIDNYELHKGWFVDTLPTVTCPDGIALLRLDGDWYDSTMQCLEALYQHVNPGGVIIIDDWFVWRGCKRAVREYLSKHRIADTVQQTGSDPVAYIVKG